MSEGLFLVFLAAAAAQDLRRQQIELWVYLVFGTVAAAVLVIGCMENADGAGMIWQYLGDRAAGAVLGLVLLGFGAVSRGGIGAGDGLFFLISGLMLGFWDNLALLCYGILCCGSFCLGYFMWKRLQRAGAAGCDTVPFLPFVAIPGIWLCMKGLGW